MAEFDLQSLSARLLRAPPPREEQTEDARAAVAMVLRTPPGGGEAEILFIRRALRERDPWSGHIAFPGGRAAPDDASLLDTARRETLEEVGLPLDARATLLARLHDVPARARGKRFGLTISPFVFALERDADAPLVLDTSEVAEALWTPIAPLARGEGRGTYSFEVGGDKYELPSLAVGPHTLWGLTHAMFHTLLAVVAGDYAARPIA